MAKIAGIENLSPEQLNFEIQQGGKFVMYYYCVSVLVITFRRGSSIYFFRAGQSRIAKGLGWTLLSFIAGWWGIPWGPIYTIQSIGVNCSGGKDVTAEVLNSLSRVRGVGA